MFPVFSLVLDKDVKSEVAMLYPELYKDLLKVWAIFVCFGLGQNRILIGNSLNVLNQMYYQ